MDQIRLLSIEEFTRFITSLNQEHLSGNEPGLLQALSDWMEEGNCRVGICIYGLFRGGVPAGVIGASEEHDLEKLLGVYTLIGVIYVHPDYRRQGIGRTLVDHMLKNGRTEWFAASPADDQAWEFFRGAGFFPLATPELRDENLVFFQKKEVSPMTSASS